MALSDVEGVMKAFSWSHGYIVVFHRRRPHMFQLLWFFCNLVTYYDYEMLVCAYAALFLVTIILFV